MDKKSILITSAITVFLFSFFFFLIYIIYCFAYYDENQEKKYLNNFNNGSYQFVYDNLKDKELIDYDDFSYTYNLMFKRDKLNEIHHRYYSDMDVNEFMNLYYYGGHYEKDDFSFGFTGKTNLFKRRSLYYNQIKVSTLSSNKSVFGVFKDIYLLIDYDSKLYIDEEECEVVSRACYLKYALGGLHFIKYENSGITYYGFLNIDKDNLEISINNLDSLVKEGEGNNNQ